MDKNNENIILRVRQLVNELNLSDAKFAARIDMEKSGFSKRMTGQVAIGSGVINKIILALKVNKTWLLTGVGEKYILENYVTSIWKDSDFVQVPVIATQSYSEYLQLHKNEEYMQKLYSIPLKVDSTYKGEYRVFQVEGDAMFDGTYKSILSNDLVLGRKIEICNFDLLSKSMYGRVFILVHSTGIILRKLISFDSEDQSIVLSSLNPFYNNIILSVDNLMEIYNIIKIIEREV